MWKNGKMILCTWKGQSIKFKLSIHLSGSVEFLCSHVTVLVLKCIPLQLLLQVLSICPHLQRAFMWTELFLERTLHWHLLIDSGSNTRRHNKSDGKKNLRKKNPLKKTLFCRPSPHKYTFAVFKRCGGLISTRWRGQAESLISSATSVFLSTLARSLGIFHSPPSKLFISTVKHVRSLHSEDQFVSECETSRFPAAPGAPAEPRWRASRSPLTLFTVPPAAQPVAWRRTTTLIFDPIHLLFLFSFFLRFWVPSAEKRTLSVQLQEQKFCV